MKKKYQFKDGKKFVFDKGGNPLPECLVGLSRAGVKAAYDLAEETMEEVRRAMSGFDHKPVFQVADIPIPDAYVGEMTIGGKHSFGVVVGEGGISAGSGINFSNIIIPIDKTSIFFDHTGEVKFMLAEPGDILELPLQHEGESLKAFVTEVNPVEQKIVAKLLKDVWSIKESIKEGSVLKLKVCEKSQSDIDEESRKLSADSLN